MVKFYIVFWDICRFMRRNEILEISLWEKSCYLIFHRNVRNKCLIYAQNIC